MHSKATKIRMAFFLVIAVVGIGYTGANYVGLNQFLGGGGYTIRVAMPESGGLFVNSEATYRGVAVGRVTAIDLTDEGIEARVHVDQDAPQIPSDTKAVVANRSAVGEQYIDLQPVTDSGPYLADGSVIPRHRTELPPPPESLLVNLDRLVTSVPTDSLRTVVDEVGTAFNGTGDDLQRLLDNSGRLIQTADQHLPQTTGLLDAGNRVLATQQEQDANIRAMSTGLREIAGQLKESDGDLRTVLRDAPKASNEVNALLRDSANDFGLVTANLLTTSEVFKVRTDAVEQLLVTLPVVSAFTHNLSPDDTGHLAVVLNFGNPPNCQKGYEVTERRPGSDTTDKPVNPNIRCAEPPGSPTSVRGSQNVPRQPVPEPAQAPPPMVFGN